MTTPATSEPPTSVFGSFGDVDRIVRKTAAYLRDDPSTYSSFIADGLTKLDEKRAQFDKDLTAFDTETASNAGAAPTEERSKARDDMQKRYDAEQSLIQEEIDIVKSVQGVAARMLAAQRERGARMIIAALADLSGAGSYGRFMHHPRRADSEGSEVDQEQPSGQGSNNDNDRSTAR